MTVPKPGPPPPRPPQPVEAAPVRSESSVLPPAGPRPRRPAPKRSLSVRDEAYRDERFRREAVKAAAAVYAALAPHPLHRSTGESSQIILALADDLYEWLHRGASVPRHEVQTLIRLLEQDTCPCAAQRDDAQATPDDHGDDAGRASTEPGGAQDDDD